MFIKWREENKPSTPEEEARFAPLRPAWASQKPRDPASHRLYAYVAKSMRVEGKPRQKVITYLGSIPSIAVHNRACDEWRHFWYKVHCALLLAGASYKAYHDIFYELARRVERPSQEELVDIVSNEFESHPRWHKDYEAISKVIERSDSYWPS